MADQAKVPISGSIPPGPHPRRPPAHRSVSLLHSSQATSREDGSAAGSTLANPSSSPPSKRGTTKNSSGESSNAERWFENSNNNPESEAPSFVDNDPPFFLRNSSSGDTPPDRTLYVPMPADGTLPFRASHAMSLEATSSSEDFRSVIDDLTIENKRLKKRLKKYEKLQTARLHEDKLFEIRVHGLPPDKKQELEEYLKKFTMDLDKSPATADNTTTATSSGLGNSSGVEYGSSRPSLRAQVTKSSYTSQFTDSAYASNSASGMHIGARSNVYGAPQVQPPRSQSSTQQRQQNIRNYLKDIPAGLMPQQDAPMSDRTRKKLVVRRLEQIFAGKGAAAGGHQHPIQQEEIAQSAAMADRSALEASGALTREEGHREARIMADLIEAIPSAANTAKPIVTDSKLGQSDNLLKPPTTDSRVLRQTDAHDFANTGDESPDQRPTRPLDLDPFRAQVPAENLEYIRHLGFSPLDYGASSPIDGHSWIYLNVLTNMAQLHTLNVTADFVRQAVDEYSKKLELSKDGRKLRWRGGKSVTRNSSDEGTPNDGGRSVPYIGNGSSNRRANPSQTTSDVSYESTQPTNKLAYVPLFAHKNTESDEESSFGDDSMESSIQPDPTSAPSGLSGLNSSTKKRRMDDGPIIFYNKASFITDLSGNHRPNQNRIGRAAHYQALHTRPVGTQRGETISTDSDSMEDIRGPLTNISLNHSAEDDSSSMPSGSEVLFMPAPLPSSRSSGETSETIEFEASGIGGVRPLDNFAIHVRSEHVTLPNNDEARDNLPQLHAHMYSNKIRDIFDQGDATTSPTDKGQGRRLSHTQPVISERIISSRRRELPASTLPEASYLALDSMDEDDSDMDSDDDQLSDAQNSSTSRCSPIAATQKLTTMGPPSASSEMGSSSPSAEDDVELSDDESESVDFLASVRKTHPKTIRAREREFDGEMADRLAEEIPAGSSAATAGGGSGFNSPDSETNGMTDTGVGVKSRGPSLKRMRTGDSLAGPGKTPKIG